MPTNFLLGLHSRSQRLQVYQAQIVVTASRIALVRAGAIIKVNSLNAILSHRMDQILNSCRCCCIIYDDRTLVQIIAREVFDRRSICIVMARQRTLELNHRVTILEQLRRAGVSRVKYHRSQGRWHFYVSVCRCIVVVSQGSLGGGGADVVEEDAANRDVGLGVFCPISISIDVGGDVGIRSLSEGSIDVPQGDDIGIAIELRDAGDIVWVTRV